MMIKDLKARNEYADEEFVWTIFAQLVSALYRCHYGEDPPDVNSNALGLTKNALPLKSKQAHKMILHRDLKPENGMTLFPIVCPYMAADRNFQFSLVKAMQSNLVTSVSPRSSFPTTSPLPTSAPPSTCRPKSVPPNAIHYTRTSGHSVASSTSSAPESPRSTLAPTSSSSKRSSSERSLLYHAYTPRSSQMSSLHVSRSTQTQDLTQPASSTCPELSSYERHRKASWSCNNTSPQRKTQSLL